MTIDKIAGSYSRIGNQLSTIKERSGLDKALGQGDDKVSFSDFLKKGLEDVNSSALQAERSVQDAVMGREVNPHNTIIALQKAEISFSLLTSIRDRLESAYQQIMRTQL